MNPYQVLRRAFLGIGFGTVVACGSIPQANTVVSLDELRSAAKNSTSGEKVGRWLLDEMFAPSGTAPRAAEARAQLDKTTDKGLYAALGGALYDELHGEPQKAASAYITALSFAKSSDDPAAPLAAWFASSHLVRLRASVANLWARNKSSLLALIAAPGNIGWRSLAELHEWSTTEAWRAAEVTGDAYDSLVTSRMGCARNIRIAGPFGHNTAPDRRRSFPAETAPWPASWPADPLRGTIAHVLKTERHHCVTTATEQTADGVFYVEAYFDTPDERDLLVAVQGSVATWVDDVLLSERDLREWGVWQRFGGAVRVGPGRHRVLSRVMNDSGSIRLLNIDGTSAKIETDIDARRPYGLARPARLPNPNPIDSLVTEVGAGKSPTLTPLAAALAAHAAHVDGLNDVAAVLMAPLVTPKDAAPVSLLMAALYAHSDVAFSEQTRRTNEKEFYARAVSSDPRLWYARAWLVLDDAEQRGLVEAVQPLRKLASDVSSVPEITEQLARVYGKLGWRAERMQVLKELSERFPDDQDALALYVAALEEDSDLSTADKMAERLQKLDADSEIELQRTIARRDWQAAIAELRRLQKRRPDRKEIAGRIADLLARSGDPSAAAAQLEKALAKNPADSAIRLRIADHAYAKGDTTALRRALAAALQAGSKGVEIREAVELIEGASLLEPYRANGRAIIKEFEAWEKSGKHMDGNAARVFDYAATWVHEDGSSEMLEHEILRMQSQESVTKEAEQQPPGGLILNLRVIKPDGSILEPEPVEGKQTLTMPHLEVGDYLEIEHITSMPSEGPKGKTYRGPHWFFREADKGYWRSEFVVLAPKDKKVEIEVVGNVPNAKTVDKGPFLERRWRVDESPPAPEEPESPNPREFLPSIRVGWGIDLASTLLRYVDAASEETPLDPRLRKIAKDIVGNIPPNRREELARAAYRWVGETLQESNETDGRRAITGRAGSRQSAFMYLMRLLNIRTELALVKSRIAMPAVGKMSEVESYDNIVARLDTGAEPRFMVIRDKFAPFGYVPAELRGQPAIRLVAGTPRETTPRLGAADGVTMEGKAVLKNDGSATVELAQSYTGNMGIRLRYALDRVPESRLHEFVETSLLASKLPGARLRDLKIENAKDLSAPVVLRMRADVPQIARVVGNRLLLKALFPVNIAQVASLATRQTPLLLAASSHVEVNFEIQAPSSFVLPSAIPGGELRDGDRSVSVSDRISDHSIFLRRVVDIPAGRVQPGAEYARFVAFTRQADQLLEKEIALGR